MNQAPEASTNRRFLDTFLILHATILRLSRYTLLVLLGSMILWVALLSSVRGSAQETTWLLLMYGEVLVPLVVAAACLTSILDDPCREILLTTIYPFWLVTFSRLLCVLGFACFTWSLLLCIAFGLQPQVHLGFLRLFLGGFIPTLLFACLGLWAALRFRDMFGGGVFSASAWVLPLIFRELLLSYPVGHLIHPFLTLQAPTSPLWWANRCSLLAIALVFLWRGLRLASCEEPLVQQARGE